MPEKMYITPYSPGVIYRPEFSVDGLDFDVVDTCLLLGNKIIPKDYVSMIEFKVNSYFPLNKIKNLPLYVGVHEQPSMGLLNGNCSFGSLFFKEGEDFTIFDHASGSTTKKERTPTSIGTRIPAATDVIGLKFDTKNNTITIYNDGEEFYSFKPLFLHLNTGNYYPAIFVINNCDIHGRVNFGRKGLEYPIPGAYSMYGPYYKKKELTPPTFNLFFTVDKKPLLTQFNYMLFDFVTDSDIVPGQKAAIFMESNEAVFTDDEHLHFEITKPSTNNFDFFGPTLVSSRPIPYEKKVYLEFQIHNGIMINGNMGIPISAGITNTKGFIMDNSVRIDVFHRLQSQYEYKIVESGISNRKFATDVLTSVAPSQAMWVGMAFDLKNHEYTVYINSIPFYKVKFPNLDMKYTKNADLYYFLLHDEGVESNDDPFWGQNQPMKGEVNFGETPLHTTLPEGYITLWDYYNKWPVEMKIPDINFYFDAYPYKMKIEEEVFFHFFVIEKELFPQEASSNPGINQLEGTMNRVLDEEPHFIPDQGIELLDMLMRADNSGYTTETNFDQEDYFHGLVTYVAKWS